MVPTSPTGGGAQLPYSVNINTANILCVYVYYDLLSNIFGHQSVYVCVLFQQPSINCIFVVALSGSLSSSVWFSYFAG